MNLPEKAENSLDMVIKRFKSGELPKAMAQTVIEGDRPLDKWSFRNKVIAFAHNTTDARGYKQWQKVGRQVEKGASAFYIFGPIIKTVEEEKEKENGETVVEEEEKLVGFRTIPVFRKEDTKGEPLDNDYGPDQLPPLKAVLDALEYDVEYAPKTTAARGSTDPNLKRIELNTEDERTWFHEMAHAVDGQLNDLEGGQHADQEIVAESVAATLCQLYGLEGYLQHSADYIKHYGNGDPYEAIMKYLDRVKTVLQQIFTLVEDREAQKVAA